MTYSRIQAASCMLLLGWITGCGSADPSLYKGPTATVSGKVTLEGKPVPQGCTVTFRGAEKSYLAVGIVQNDGKYELKYRGSRNVPAIKYVVTVNPPIDNTPAKAVDPAAAALSTIPTKDPKKPATPEGPIPFKYGSTSTSGLSYTIEAGAKTQDIDLKP